MVVNCCAWIVFAFGYIGWFIVVDVCADCFLCCVVVCRWIGCWHVFLLASEVNLPFSFALMCFCVVVGVGVLFCWLFCICWAWWLVVCMFVFVMLFCWGCVLAMGFA